MLVASHHMPARIQDVTDGFVPGYTADLLKLVQGNVDHATTDPRLYDELGRRSMVRALIARNMFGAATDHPRQLYYAAIANEGTRKLFQHRVAPRFVSF